MERVTRKSFGALSKRQQYTRLANARVLEKSLTSNLKCQQEKNVDSTNKDVERMEVEINNASVEYFEDQRNDNSESRNNEEYSSEVNVGNVNEANVTERVLIDCTENLNVGDRNLTEGIEIQSTENFKNLLRQCCLDMNINLIQTKAVLRVLRIHPCFNRLPKDSRTLLKTGRDSISLIPVGNGVYWYIGFLRTLESHLSLFINIPSLLEIEINTDGLSLSKSNPSTFWPIQYRVLNIEGFKPLIAGIYKGAEKPSDPSIFFQSFVEEVTKARLAGGVLFKNRRIPFIFKRFVADDPARALMLNHYGHNSRKPCSKCKVTGVRFENRIMTYLGITHTKRTDEEYINNIDENHQKGESPLSKLSIPLVTGTVFDVMHLVYLGVTVRFLNAWTKGQFGYAAKLPTFSVNELYYRYEQLEKTCPNDFARRPRKLDKYSNFKATELRHFTLYAAPAILYGILSDEHYFHFLVLNISMGILTSPNPQSEQLNVAEAALKVLVEHAPGLYTQAFISYNVHCLQHLVEDARQFGSLDGCAAFIYENNMPLFRKNIRNHPLPLQQFANRLKEKSSIQHFPGKQSVDRLSQIHDEGPKPENVDELNYTQYKKYESPKFDFTLDKRNCFCKMEDSSICKIENILTIEENVFVVVRKFEHVTNFFENPIASSYVGIHKCKHLLQKLCLMSISNIAWKCYCMPSWKSTFASTKLSEEKDDEYIIVTLLHTEKP